MDPVGAPGDEGPDGEGTGRSDAEARAAFGVLNDAPPVLVGVEFSPAEASGPFGDSLGAGGLQALVGVEPTPAAASGLFGDSLAAAEQYVALLATRGVEWGLIGPREAGRLWERHVLNSLAVAGFVGEGATVVDVGAGAGLPGIPLALARPDLRITLLEPLERRVTFLESAVDELGVRDRVRVVRARAEDHRGFYDVATCRAVAPLSRLLDWTTALFSPGGRLVALKGESASEELDAAARVLRRRRLSGRVEVVRVYPDAEPTRVIVVE